MTTKFQSPRGGNVENFGGKKMVYYRTVSIPRRG